jgi:thiamine pyrophosphate-dependent acetolactate synthase large subunit-like protein
MSSTSWASTRSITIQYDAPLTADIEGIARPFSHWVKTSPTAETVAGDGAEAIQRSPERGAGPDRDADPAGRHRLG